MTIIKGTTTLVCTKNILLLPKFYLRDKNKRQENDEHQEDLKDQVLAPTFLVYAAINNLYDLKQQIGNEKVKSLYNSLCYGKASDAQSPITKKIPCGKTMNNSRGGYIPRSPTLKKHANNLNEGCEYVKDSTLCVLCMRKRDVRIPLCGHGICASCCGNLSSLEESLEQSLVQFRSSAASEELISQVRGTNLYKFCMQKHKFFCCPVCEKWDMVRINKYIKSVIKYVHPFPQPHQLLSQRVRGYIL